MSDPECRACREYDGDVAIDVWLTKDHSLYISINETGLLRFAWISPDGSGHGTGRVTPKVHAVLAAMMPEIPEP